MDANAVSCVCPQSQQGHTVYCDQQAVVSQHSKTAASPSSPSIDNTATNPNRIKHSQGGIGHSERHSKRTANRHSPSRNFQVETNRIGSMVLPDPIKYLFYRIIHVNCSHSCSLAKFLPLASTCISNWLAKPKTHAFTAEFQQKSLCARSFCFL